jgi:hypothetical protein
LDKESLLADSLKNLPKTIGFQKYKKHRQDENVNEKQGRNTDKHPNQAASIQV